MVPNYRHTLSLQTSNQIKILFYFEPIVIKFNRVCPENIFVNLLWSVGKLLIAGVKAYGMFGP